MVTLVAVLLLAGCASLDDHLKTAGTSTDTEDRIAAIRVLAQAAKGSSDTAAQRKQDITQLLRRLLVCPSALVRQAAVAAIAVALGPDGAEEIADRLRDSDMWVRTEAARQLGRIRASSQIQPLSEAALGDENVDVRRSAVVALGRLGDKRAFGPLSLALADADESVRYAGQQALVLIHGQDLGARPADWQHLVD